MEFLVFQLYGPLAAWGEIAVGEHRPSVSHPSKSAVLGLLAAALGVRRDETARQQALAEGYGFAVRVEAAGALLRDYHTVQKPAYRRSARYYTRKDELADNLDTILSQRDYRTDAFCRIALWAKDDLPHTLSQLADALLQPQFVLYLGRKSCPPSLPLAPRVFADTLNLKQAFDRHKAIYPPPNRLKPAGDRQQQYHWENLDRASVGIDAVMSYPRHDKPISRIRWQFQERNEYFALESEKDVAHEIP